LKPCHAKPAIAVQHLIRPLVKRAETSHSAQAMESAAEYSLEQDSQGGARLVLSGAYLVSTIGPIDQDLLDLGQPVSEIDLTEVEEIDTVGAYIVCSVARTHHAAIVGATAPIQRIINAIDQAEGSVDTSAPREPAWERVPFASIMRGAGSPERSAFSDRSCLAQ
jgi:ABC-type transporter Mla MlaB component